MLESADIGSGRKVSSLHILLPEGVADNVTCLSLTMEIFFYVCFITPTGVQGVQERVHQRDKGIEEVGDSNSMTLSTVI